jgi:riboflavin kinase / FMN adenylyltransferase
MRIIRSWNDVPHPLKGGVVALGNFDGLHLGHQAVLGTTMDIAKTSGAPAAVMTFEPHPRAFFKPDQEAFRLCPFRMKARLIAAIGIDYLYAQAFDQKFSERSAENFVKDILVGGLGISHVVVGYDYVFGHKRTGNVDVLKDFSAQHKFGVTAVEEMKPNGGARFSSTNIRNHLKEGQCAEAAQLLGRYWEIEGRVEQGDKRGRLLGFPTANLPYKNYVHPKKGVYAVRAGIDRGAETVWHDGVANFGNRPTFDKTDILLEVHLLDADMDLYGKHLRVALVEHIREERKFDGLDALKSQIFKDSETARSLLADHPFPKEPAPFVRVPPDP